MKTIFALAACAALTACGTSPGQFDNLLTLSLSGDRAFVTSLYGPIGVTAELRTEDARELMAMREKARFAEQVLSATARTPVGLERVKP